LDFQEKEKILAVTSVEGTRYLEGELKI